MRLNRNFFARRADIVAKELLGKVLVVKHGDVKLKGKIVETEAYFGEWDPASRAREGKKQFNRILFEGMPGQVFVYYVHKHLMLNFLAKPVSAVLIRAVEPLEGIEFMKEKRKVEDIRELCSGPGRLTQAFGIDKSFYGEDAVNSKRIWVEEQKVKEDFEIGSSQRIGVKEDFDVNLRFFIKSNPFVSKAKPRVRVVHRFPV